MNWLLKHDVQTDQSGSILRYRWTLFEPPSWLPYGLAVYVHKFVGGDERMHSHSAPFISIGLRGAYAEQRVDFVRHREDGVTRFKRSRDTERVYTAPWVRFFPADSIHRVQPVGGAPCWTMVIGLGFKRPDYIWHGDHWMSRSA